MASFQRTSLLSSLCLVLTIHALAQQMKLAFPILFSFHTNGIPYSTVFLALPVPFPLYQTTGGQLAVDSTVDEVLFQLESVALAKILNLVVPPWYTLLGERARQFGFHFYFAVKMAPKCRGRNMIAPGRVRHQTLRHTGVSSKRGG